MGMSGGHVRWACAVVAQERAHTIKPMVGELPPSMPLNSESSYGSSVRFVSTASWCEESFPQVAAMTPPPPLIGYAMLSPVLPAGGLARVCGGVGVGEGVSSRGRVLR